MSYAESVNEEKCYLLSALPLSMICGLSAPRGPRRFGKLCCNSFPKTLRVSSSENWCCDHHHGHCRRTLPFHDRVIHRRRVSVVRHKQIQWCVVATTSNQMVVQQGLSIARGRRDQFPHSFGDVRRWTSSCKTSGKVGFYHTCRRGGNGTFGPQTVCTHVL